MCKMFNLGKCRGETLRSPVLIFHTPHISIVILSATKDLFNYFARVYLMFILTTDCTDRLRWALFSVDCVLLVGWNFFLWWIKTISLFKTSSIFCNKTDCTDWCSGLMLYLKPERLTYFSPGHRPGYRSNILPEPYRGDITSMYNPVECSIALIHALHISMLPFQGAVCRWLF